MTAWEKVKVTTERGDVVDAQAPVIISASRSTDIPAFYSDWFMQRLEEGFVRWINPFNRVPLYVSFEKVRLFVFWTKNPRPMLKHLDQLDSCGWHYYFQVTLNDYEIEGYEPGVPCVAERMETFIHLSERLGRERVVWRFDPLLLTDTLSVDDLLNKVERIGDQLAPFTSRFVFSFADVENYVRVRRNLKNAGVVAREFRVDEMQTFARGIQGFNQRWKLPWIGTCAEQIDLAVYGIEHNRCIDDRLMIKCFKQDAALMQFLGHESTNGGDLFGHVHRRRPGNLKDTGQRKACLCVKSKDIGGYKPCSHGCVYCYANPTV